MGQDQSSYWRDFGGKQGGPLGQERESATERGKAQVDTKSSIDDRLKNAESAVKQHEDRKSQVVAAIVDLGSPTMLVAQLFSAYLFADYTATLARKFIDSVLVTMATESEHMPTVRAGLVVRSHRERALEELNERLNQLVSGSQRHGLHEEVRALRFATGPKGFLAE